MPERREKKDIKKFELKEHEYRVLKRRVAKHLYKTADKSRAKGTWQGFKSYPYFKLIETESQQPTGGKKKMYFLVIKR